MNHSRSAALLLGATIAVGIALAGFFLGNGLMQIKAAQRYVTVKGLAEREVKADLAIWPIVYIFNAPKLDQLQTKLDNGGDIITAFLKERGFSEDEISRSVPVITDHEAQGYSNNVPKNRYSARASITVRTDKVLKLKAAMAEAGAIVSKGVALVQDYSGQPKFSFTQLNSIKPDMIADATKNARDAARQFAKDSGSTVGSIRRARQGLFTINDRDANTPEIKKVRVVTTVDYFLKD